MEPPSSSDRKHTIVDDFMYGNNVAGASVYIRMGKFACFWSQSAFVIRIVLNVRGIDEDRL